LLGNKWTLTIEDYTADNKRMNSECSIWRVLIFSVNFAPGYPRRYAAKYNLKELP